VDDRVGPRLEHGAADGLRVEEIERDGLRAELAQTRSARRRGWVPITSCPRSISWETSRLPIAPLAPAAKTLIVVSFWYPGRCHIAVVRRVYLYDPI
jgi:hypothetical protein